MAFDASPSWSGFNYQGKVALYHALYLINEKLIDSDFPNYTLMLESTEDFEIVHSGTPVSFHQVKAYDSSSFSKYSDALLEITLELYKNKGVEGKIHTWKEINSKPGFKSITESIKDEIKSIVEQYEGMATKDGSTLLEKASSENNNIPKTAAILRAAFPKNTADQLCTLLKSIHNGESDALSRLAAYTYDDGKNHCELDDINTKIKNEILKALTKRKITVTSDSLEKAFYYFLGMIDKYVTYRHQTKQSPQKQPITFKQIVESISIDHADIGEEYLAYQFQDIFFKLIDEYFNDDEDYSEPNQGTHCNLKLAKNLLLGLSAKELWALYRSFSPQVYLEQETNIKNAINIDTNGIRYVLIKILHTIDINRAVHDKAKHKFTYRTLTVPHQHYLPTTITNSAKSSQIQKQILANPDMTEILFEIENIIYGGLATHRFSPTSIKHTEAPDAMASDNRPKRDEVLKTITLVPISTAHKALG